MKFVKPTICFIIFISFISFIRPVRAVYDPLSVPNNRFGIHILDTSEVDKAAELVNSTGGDWGYVTIPIRANDRNLPAWEEFMRKSRDKHLIPILRIASFPVDDHWMAPNEYDLIDFANFLDQIDWPGRNRYIVVYNEPNHQNEWGGFVYPEEYARVLSRAADIFHKKNQDFFVIAAGLDSSAPNGPESMDIYDYFLKMNETIPGIFKQADGLSFHSYGNPGFSTAPNPYNRYNIYGFRREMSYLEDNFDVKLPVFITEAGWDSRFVYGNNMVYFYATAVGSVWSEDIVAVTPFVLSAQTGPFDGFSFINGTGEFTPWAKYYQSVTKKSGRPLLSDVKTSPTPVTQAARSTGPAEVINSLSTSIENFVSILRNLFR